MAEIAVDLVKDGQVIEARIDDHVRVCLAETPGTGYLWARTGELPAGLLETGDEFQSGQGGIGGAGRRCFQYSCGGAFDTRLTYVLRRPWLPDTIENRISVRFACTPADAR